MYKGEEIVAFAEKNKPIIWGLFLSTIIFGYAVANIFFGIISALFLVQIIQNKKVSFKRSLWPIVIYFLWGSASLIWTTNVSHTLSGIGLTFPFIAMPLLISQYSDFSIDDLGKSVRVFSTSLIFYLLGCLTKACLLFFEDKQLWHFFYHDLVSIFNNNAIYISLAVALCIVFMFNFPKKRPKDFVMISFLGFFLLLLSSKNIIITTFLLILLTAFIKRKNIKIALVIFFVLGIIALFLTISNNPIKDRFQAEMNLNTQYILHGQDFYDYAFSGFEVRLFQWRLMGEMIANHQVGVLGLGLHNVDYLLEQYFSYYNLYKGYFYINFHNQYLQTLGELGFVGLAFLLIMLSYSVLRSFKTRNVYRMLSVLLFMVAFFTESFLSRQKGVYLFAIIYCLASTLITNYENDRKVI